MPLRTESQSRGRLVSESRRLEVVSFGKGIGIRARGLESPFRSRTAVSSNASSGPSGDGSNLRLRGGSWGWMTREAD